MPKSKNSQKNAKVTNQNSKKKANKKSEKTDLVLKSDNVMTPEELKGQYDVLPKEMKEKFDKVKPNVEKFTKNILEKFDEYIMGVALLPDQKDEKGNLDTKSTHLLILVDDSDSKKMTKYELKEKLSKIIYSMAQDIDKSMQPNTIILSELWQSLYDQKFELVNMVAFCAPVYDRGILSAVKISETHKRMVIKKFEKYIVSHCIAGAFTKGRRTQQSDIDVYIVIDDTDVKKMTRVELKDKLRAIIISMGYEAKQITGVNREFHIQVYILTDFWDSLKEAHQSYLIC